MKKPFLKMIAQQKCRCLSLYWPTHDAKEFKIEVVGFQFWTRKPDVFFWRSVEEGACNRFL